MWKLQELVGQVVHQGCKPAPQPQSEFLDAAFRKVVTVTKQTLVREETKEKRQREKKTVVSDRLMEVGDLVEMLEAEEQGLKSAA